MNLRAIILSTCVTLGMMGHAHARSGPANAPSSADRKAANQHYKQAEDLIDKDDFTGAIAKLDIAIGLSPEPEFYSLRAEAHEGLANAPDATDSSRVILLRAAASDLDSYLRVGQGSEEVRAHAAQRRDDLRKTAAELEEEPSPISEPAPPPPPPTPPRAPPLGWILLGSGAAMTVTGTILAPLSFRASQECDMSGATCSDRVAHRARFLAPAMLLGAVGGALVAGGTVLVVRRASESPEGAAKARLAGQVLLGVSGALVLGGAISGIVAGVAFLRADERESNSPELKNSERAANASLAFLALMPASIGAGVAALLVSKKSGKQATASVYPLVGPQSLGASVRIPF